MEAGFGAKKAQAPRPPGHPTPLSLTLEQVAGRLLSAPQARIFLLWRTWEEVVGAAMAAHTEPVRLSGRRLTVRVDSPVWLAQLQFLKEKVLEAFHGRHPDLPIEEVRLTQGSLRGTIDHPVAAPAAPPLPPPLPEEVARVEALVARIAHPPLRAVLTTFLLRVMARKRHQAT